MKSLDIQLINPEISKLINKIVYLSIKSLNNISLKSLNKKFIQHILFIKILSIVEIF
jgi:hypothetical protein